MTSYVISIFTAELLLFAVSVHGESSQARVDSNEEARWLRWVIPLPKQARIESKVHVSASDVRLRLREAPGDIEKNAARELIALFKDKAGADPSGSSGSFEVLMGVSDAEGKLTGITIPGAADLAKLPNTEQAYIIRPTSASQLALTALDERGVYYAAKTFQQLIEAQFNDAKVSIPLAEITDWPDLSERGEWGGSATRDIEWLADHKLNLVEAHASLKIDENGKGVATISKDLLQRGRLHAVKVVPIIMHLDYLRSSGIEDRFPEVKGVGDTARAPAGGDPLALCFSKSKTNEILTDWVLSLAENEEVTDINVWLSEYAGQCGCAECKRALEQGRPQHVLETQAVGRAIQIAQQRHPNIRARVLLTQGTYPVNDKILANVPPEVDVSYYCGGGRPRSTYNSSREPMIYPLLTDYAAKGNWLEVYPQFTASYGVVCPWNGPQFIKSLMAEFVDKGLKSVCGYTVPNNQLHDFNVAAAAEWSWNVRGRSERDFAAAWATRRGLKDPDAAAEWAVLLGPVGWDIYGSGKAAATFLSPLRAAARLVASGTKPTLGKGIWRYFDSVEKMNHNLAICERASAIAERLDAPAILAETKVIQGYSRMVKEIFVIADSVADADLSADETRLKLQEAMCRLAGASVQTVEGLKDWEHAIGPPIGAPRYRNTLRSTEQTMLDVAKALAPFGIQDPSEPYRPRRIGQWSSDDFGNRTSIRMQFEVKDYFSKPGRYRAQFEYTKGRNGLPIRRVALASSPKKRPAELTECSVDEHEAFAGHQSRANTYIVNLPSYDPELRYFITADAAAPPSTNGLVWIKSDVKMPSTFPVPALPPLTDEQRASLRARFRGPSFSKGRLSVGVLRGGYGSTSLLKYLREVRGIDAQAAWRLEKGIVDKCQVLVLPQPRSVETLGEREAKFLAEFVRAGGGLVVTHNAVGYRGFPPIVPEVCARGIKHVRDPEWVVVMDHPITRGIPGGQALPHSYYDHIELEPGPKGIVLAKARISGKPVVICGDFGKGRYIACGLAIGLSPDDEDLAPAGAEKALLENAVRWAGQGE